MVVTAERNLDRLIVEQVYTATEELTSLNPKKEPGVEATEELDSTSWFLGDDDIVHEQDLRVQVHAKVSVGVVFVRCRLVSDLAWPYRVCIFADSKYREVDKSRGLN